MNAILSEAIKPGMTSNAPEALRIENISHSVIEAGNEKRTLAPLTRSFEPGRFTVVGGPSGAGKTTLLSILSTTVRPTQGLLRWGASNLTAMKPDDQAIWRRANLGLVFQTSRLVSVMTVAEHIRLASAARGDPAAVAEGLELLARFGLETRLSALPERLSGGERQRVAIVQALCFRPRLLLADEPTAALDQNNAQLVAASLRTYARAHDAVVICVSHDRVVMDAADDLLMLEKA